LATVTEAASSWLGERGSFLSPRELLGEALLLRGFHARMESGRLRVILDHPSDRAALDGILDLAPDGRVRAPRGAAAPLPGGDGAPGADGDPWLAAARQVIAVERGDVAPDAVPMPEDGWRQFRSRGRWRPLPVVSTAGSLDLGVALLARALCLLDCKVTQGHDGREPGPGGEAGAEARIELASPWDAILAATLVAVGAGSTPSGWRWAYRTLHVPHAAGRERGGLSRTLGELQHVARALLEHRRFGFLRRARVRAIAEQGPREPNPEAFRAALRRIMLEGDAPARV
jgi:hypothetical protein